MFLFLTNKFEFEFFESTQVKKLVFRQKFDYGLHSDIVLVQLDRPLKTDHMYIQPICLPVGKK